MGEGYNFEDMSEESIQISLSMEDVKWAMTVSQASIEKWSDREGYYNNRINSHLKGKLGELAVGPFNISDQEKNLQDHQQTHDDSAEPVSVQRKQQEEKEHRERQHNDPPGDGNPELVKDHTFRFFCKVRLASARVLWRLC